MTDPSPWVADYAAHIPNGARILDVACGTGRHTRYFLSRGHRVTAIDQDTSGLADLSTAEELELIEADLEDGTPWPLAGRTFDAVVVTNYLFRPLFPDLVASVARQGVLIYDTFAVGNEAYGKPSRPDFLLKEGELLDAVKGELDVVAYDHGFIDKPPSVRQRLCARRP